MEIKQQFKHNKKNPKCLDAPNLKFLEFFTILDFVKNVYVGFAMCDQVQAGLSVFCPSLLLMASENIVGYI